MTESTLQCPICGGDSRFAGKAFLKTDKDQSKIETRFFWCSSCDLFHRELTHELLMTNNEVAHYSNLDHEKHFKDIRMGYFDVLVDLFEDLIRRRPCGEVGESPRMLDVGCAYGHLIERAQERGFQGAGVEINEGNVEFARSQGLDVHTTLDKVDGQFDVIAMIDALYYVPDPVAFMEELRQRLRPGGVVVARVTNRNFEARMRCRRDSEADLSFFLDHTVGFSPRSMRKVLEGSNYKKVRVRSESGRGKVLKKRSRRIYGMTSALATVTFDKVILTPGFYGIGYRGAE